MFETEIKAALKKAGLAESLVGRITVKTVDEIEGAVTALKTDIDRLNNLTDAEFLDAVKKAGLEDSFKRYSQKDFDRRATEAIRKHDEKLKQASEAEAKKKAEEEGLLNLTADQKEIRSLRETVEGFAKTLGGVTSKQATSDLKLEIQAALKKEGIPEKFASYVNVDNPDGIADSVADLKKSLGDFQQAGIDKQLEAGVLSPGKSGSVSESVQEAAVADFAKSLNVKGEKKIDPSFPGKISSAKAETA